MAGVWACLAGELGVAAPPGVWDGERFLSSEKSCLITSKKLLNGLPTQTEEDKRERENRQEMSREVSGMEGGQEDTETAPPAGLESDWEHWETPLLYLGGK